jgi:excisionase family DNA binding protein
MSLISTIEAAARLGIHQTRVQVLIREGRLPAQKVGRAYVINEHDLKLVADRQTGRPPKAKAEALPIGNKQKRVVTPKKEAKKGGK